MTTGRARAGFAARPTDPDTWVRTSADSRPGAKGDSYTARLTIDVTPDLRGRIKIAAFQRGLTATDMLRVILEREFPPAAPNTGDAR